MAVFSATDVALSGVRFVQAHPRTVAIWGAIQLAISLTITVLTIKMIGPMMPDIAGRAGSGPAVVGALMGKMAVFYAVGIPLIVAYQAIVLSTACRAVFTPQNDRAAYLRLGKDELRQGLLILLFIVVLIGFEIALAVAVMLPGILLAVTVPAMQNVVIVAIPLVVFAAVALFAVRLSLAGPLTYDSGRVKLWASWKLTRGHFWKMLGAYLLAFLMAMAVGVLVSVVAFAAAALLGAGTDWTSFILTPDFRSASAYFTLPRLIYLAVSAVGAGLTLPLIYFPPVEIYRRISAARAVEPTSA